MRRFFLLLLILGGLGIGIYYGGQSLWEEKAEVLLPEAIEQLSSVEFDFKTPEELAEWKEHTFKDHTTYEIVEHEGEKVLNTKSQAASSALFHEVGIPLAHRPKLVWDWKVLQFPAGKKNESFAAGNENDFAARVYAAFESGAPLRHHVIQYVWDDHFPEDTVEERSSLHKIKVIVVQSGPSAEGWAHEERDLAADYEKLYGSAGDRRLLVIGLMSDSDNTNSSSEALFRGFTIQFNERAGGTVRRDDSLFSKVQDGVVNGFTGLQRNVVKVVEKPKEWIEGLGGMFQKIPEKIPLVKDDED